MEVLAADGLNNRDCRQSFVDFKTPTCSGGDKKVSNVKLDERDEAVRPTCDLRRDGFNPAIDRHGYQATERDRIDSETVHTARTAQDTVRRTALIYVYVYSPRRQNIIDKEKI